MDQNRRRHCGVPEENTRVHQVCRSFVARPLTVISAEKPSDVKGSRSRALLCPLRSGFSRMSLVLRMFDLSISPSIWLLLPLLMIQCHFLTGQGTFPFSSFTSSTKFF